ncbi:MAG: orotidine 5'-phosphate decarboxylase / HUMPS family protein, partial [Nanoarchaeota archaeon]
MMQKYLEAVGRKGSVLCAGLDPAEAGMNRGDEGLSDGVNKRDWALRYVEAVSPFAAALKPNTNYWEDAGDVEALREIVQLAHEKGMFVIEDSKRRDIGSTNGAGLFYAARNG